MKRLLVFLLAPLVALPGCQSSDKKLAEDQAAFQQTVANVDAGLQWKLDQATADGLFVRHYSDAPDVPTQKWYTFRHCHDLGLETGRVCGPLFDQIHRAEDKASKQQKAEDAALRGAN